MNVTGNATTMMTGNATMSSDWSPVLKGIHFVCATAGLLPSVVAACDARFALAATTFFATSAALVHVSVPEPRALVPGAIDALSSVVVTVSCAISLCSHRTLVGILRVMWLIVLVTSSCGFNFVKERLPTLSFIPNDITIGALMAGGVLLCMYAYFQRGTRARRDGRSIAVEAIFVLGAFALRFRADIARITTIDAGLAIWHTFQWSAVMATLWILRTPRRETTDERVVVETSSFT